MDGFEIKSIVHPCICGHKMEKHFDYEETYSDWIFHEDVGHEVEVQTSYPRPVCSSCNTDCLFQEMDNLEFLEWKDATIQNNKAS